MAKDILTRAICSELNVRAYTVNSLNTVKEITTLHSTTPNATDALGKTITVAALLSSSLESLSDQTISLKFHGDGPIKEVYVQTDAKGNIRGLVANPNVDITDDIGKISFSKSIGAGFLTVVKDLNLKESYKSVNPLLYGTVAKDVADYLFSSEQIPSAIILGIKLGTEGEVLSSGGILIQTFPDTPEDVILKIEENINQQNYNLGESLYKGEDINFILSSILDNNSVEILNTMEIRHSCRCSKGLIGSALRGLSIDVLEEMQKEDKGAEATCTFCRKKYYFSESDLEKIIRGKKN